MNAAKAIVSHFATSNGRNKTIFIHSNAARKGAMISIFGAVPFMTTFHRFVAGISSNKAFHSVNPSWIAAGCVDLILFDSSLLCRHGAGSKS
jgi:hypothetical protein